MNVGKTTSKVELQRLEQAWDHENWFQSRSQGKFLYLQTESRVFNSMYWTSVVRFFVLLLSFSFFSDRRSLKKRK